MNHSLKSNFTVPLIVTKSLLLLMAAFYLTGCSNMQLQIKQPARVTGYQTEHGSLSVKVSDERWTTGRIGVLRGGFGNEVRDIFVADDLNVAFTSMLTQALESAGYSVVPSTNAVLRAKVTMFVVDSTGYGKFARHKVTVQLRDVKDEVKWEKTLLGEAAGMQSGTTASMEHCMNLALERLINQAVEEFSTEFFLQAVRKMNQNQQ